MKNDGRFKPDGSPWVPPGKEEKQLRDLTTTLSREHRRLIVGRHGRALVDELLRESQHGGGGGSGKCAVM